MKTGDKLKVGLIFEGTYPYVTGGVSSWGHELIKSLKDIEFCIIHLGDVPKEKIPRYVFPENVTDYFEFFLFADYKIKKKKLPKEMLRELRKIIVYPFDEKFIAEKLIEILKKYHDYDFLSLLNSEIFWDEIVYFYEKFLSDSNFTDFYWFLRSLLIPFLNSLSIDLPKCDVYHTITTGYAGINAVINGIRNNVPVILTEHGIYHRERRREIIKAHWIREEYKSVWIKLFYIFSSLTYKYSSKITTLFEKNQLFEKELCSDTSKFMIIPNGINIEKFSKINYRKEKEPFVVGLVGRVVEIKDIKTAIKAISVVKNKIKNLKFLIIGPTDEEPEYYQQCKEMVEIFGLEDIVDFTGPVNMMDYYPKLNLLLLSSISEGLPLVILEAFASGIPVVATDVGACYELINGTNSEDDIKGKAGIVVKPKDYFGLADAIYELYSNDNFRLEASNIAKKRVQKKYNLKDVVEKYRQLYFSVVK